MNHIPMSMRNTFLTLLASALFASSAATARADVKLPAIFSDHMVLQQGVELPVWGSAAAGEKVSVTFADKTVSAQADADGKWALKFPPLMPSTQPATFVVRGNNTITVGDVLVGQVWFSSGQSNMAMEVKAADNADAQIAAANFPAVRWFMIEAVNSEKPLSDTNGKWITCSPATAGDFSATAYFFARDLHNLIKEPVGMVHAAWGGSLVEWWMSAGALAATPEAKPILDSWTKVMADWPQRKIKYEKQLEDWQKAAEILKKSGSKEPKKPDPGPWHPGSLFQPSNLYNGMVAPVIPYAIRGVIWYQGESNSDKPYQYRALMPAMIRDWRSAWAEGDFPFLIVQLPNFMAAKTEPGESNWALLREAQAMTAATVPATSIVTTIDIGQADNIHPKNKLEVGRRLALAALARVYKQDVEWSGPVFRSMEIDGNAIHVSFTHAAGLKAKEGAIAGFAIAGEDRHFVWADARIDKDTVILSSPGVAKPIAVRYAWADNPDCNLVNGAGLPATPFRTDDWRSRPVFKSMVPNRYNPKQLRLSFADVGEGGFVDQPIRGFLIAGQDKVFHAAKAQFLGDTLLVWSDDVPKPVAVRYAWPGLPVEGQGGSLRAVTDLAVLPFRTDEWTDATYAK